MTHCCERLEQQKGTELVKYEGIEEFKGIERNATRFRKERKEEKRIGKGEKGRCGKEAREIRVKEKKPEKEDRDRQKYKNRQGGQNPIEEEKEERHKVRAGE
ncbi:hypothetical protein Tco_0586842 [Tanacetum coccineum]